MRELNGRQVDETGVVIFDESGLIDLMANKKISPEIVVQRNYETEQFNTMLKKMGHDEISFYDGPVALNTEWFTPEPFKSMDIEEFVFKLSKSAEEDARVAHELSLFNERNLYPLLRHLIFLVHFFRENDIFWGVGRGSSVNSHVLFLIGIHRINSLRYGLPIEEFLK